MNDEKKKAISVLRAIIISSPQRGKSVRELLRDYRDLEGKFVSTFGHRSIEDFLQESGEFIFENFNGELIVYEKPNEQSLHIAKLVAEQNKPKKRARQSCRPPRFTRPAPRNFVPSTSPFSGTRSANKLIFPRRFGNNLTNTQPNYEAPVEPRRQLPTMSFSFDQLNKMARNCVENNFHNANRFSSSIHGQMEEPFDLRYRLNASRFVSSSNVRAAPNRPIVLVDLTLDDSTIMNDSPRQPIGYNKQRNPSVTSKTSGTASEDKMKADNNLTPTEQRSLQKRRDVPTVSFSFEQLKAKALIENGITNTTPTDNNNQVASESQVKIPDLRDRLNAMRGISSNDNHSPPNKTMDRTSSNESNRQTNVSNIIEIQPVSLKVANGLESFIFKEFEKLKAKDSVENSIPNSTSTDNDNRIETPSQQKKPFNLRDRLNAIRGISSNGNQLPQNKTMDRTSSNESNRQTTVTNKFEIQPVGSKVTNDIESSQSVCKQNGKRDIQQASAPIYPSVSQVNSSGSQVNPSFSAPIMKDCNPFFAANLPIQQSNNRLAGRIQSRLKEQPKYDVHTVVNKNASANVEKKTMNDRLTQARLNANSAPPTILHENLTKDSANTSNVNQNKIMAPPTTSSTENASIESLLRYCKNNLLDEPKYKTFKVKPNYRFQCHVTINEIVYSTYPTDYKTENEARSETAKYALNRLIAINNRLKYPTCLDEDVELVIKLYNCLKDNPSGVFYTRIPETFQIVHQQTLPVAWEHLIENNPKLFTIDNCINDKIVYTVDHNEIEKFEQKMDKLMLPWEKSHWSLIITCIMSTVEIWGRLIDNEYRHHFDTLINDIENELNTNKKVAKQFKVGQIYLVSMSECGYRVRIEKVDQTGKRCLCFLVDEGDQRWFDMTDIYICQNKFAKYPAQAIRFALHGLDDFAENEFARPCLDDAILDRPLIGEIFTKEDDFIRLDESDDMEPIIQVVLYDTSTDDDINLNSVIVEKICSNIPAPKLLQRLTPVFVSHIADDGDVFCQLQVNGMHYVNKLIRKLTNENGQCGLQQWDANDVTDRKLFLVFDEATSKLCRAKLLQKGKEKSTMFFIDNGKTENVPVSKIFCVDSISQALINFPPQAIRTKLYGMDEVEQKVSLLRGYFNTDTLAYMKVYTPSDIPEVNLYHVKDSLITNIKDSFDLEKEYNLVIDEMAGLTIRQMQ